jgi:hypothetical protein
VAHFSNIRVRATYANVTATLALFAALGGGSFAIASLSGSERKAVKKISRKQADKRITARARGLTVEHAGSADSATNASHANAADTAANADALGGVGPGGFLPSSGDFQVQIGSDVWQDTGSGAVNRSTGGVDLTGTGSGRFFDAPITIPSIIQGRATQINSVVLCYAANANATLDKFSVAKTTAATNTGLPTFPIDDGTDRTDETCRMYTPTGGSTAVGPNDMFQAVIVAGFAAGGGTLTVSRLTVNMSD